MSDDHDRNADSLEELIDLFTKAMKHVMEESRLLATYEITVNGKLPDLGDGDRNSIYLKLDELLRHLGGPPENYIVQSGSDHLIPPSDNYPEAILREVVDVYDRVRVSVQRADLFLAGSTMLQDKPSFAELPTDDEELRIYEDLANNAFWEHAEAAYIRLASYWDRVGQVLEFAFFNIRKFEHSSFSAVLERVKFNVVPMNSALANSDEWKRLLAFHNSTKSDGYKWLSERRNMMIHNLHLHPVRKQDEAVFKSQYNHLEDRHREKMKPQEPSEEVRLLIEQFTKATQLFDDFIKVVKFSPSRKVSAFLHK